MGRHRRSGRVSKAGSTAVKAAAVMGVAGTLALGINSASDGPVRTQAMSDGAVPGEASAAAEDVSLSSAQHDDLVPTAISTEHAAEPKLIDDRAEQEARSSRSAAETREAVEQKAVASSTSTSNFGNAQTQQPTEVAPPSQSTPSEPSATTAPEPAPSGDDDGQQSGGGLVGGVVGGVGGVLGGLLG